MVLAYSDWIPRVPPYSGYSLPSNDFVYRPFTVFGCSFHSIRLSFSVDYGVRHPYSITTIGLGSSNFARHYFRNRVYFLFLRVIRCFSSPGSLRYTYLFSIRYRNITYGEFPHSDICGSLLICSSPQLFAACHVLLRRHVPRHPPVCSL